MAKRDTKKSFPYSGEIFPAKEKKYQSLIFFVHFLGGNKKALRRHIQFVNELGFDAFAFDLQSGAGPLHIPLTTDGRFGLKHLYAQQIETLLNLLPHSQKIVFSFSNVCGSAIETMSRRKCHDIRALVCDSGPSGKFAHSAYKLMSEETPYQVKFFPWRIVKSTLLGPYWSLWYHDDIHEDLETFPEGFPILSIRGWKDPMIPPEHIDMIFNPHKHLRWKKLNLPEVGHLEGLKVSPKIYQPAVSDFLYTHAEPL